MLKLYEKRMLLMTRKVGHISFREVAYNGKCLLSVQAIELQMFKIETKTKWIYKS